ncbi:MAG: hypothetical protein L6R45_10005 [Anaerolineae bacterium]|nr:hypothetical protein [Anaerolineae bacterium]
MTKCCNRKHPKEQPVEAEFVLTDRHGKHHFLCDLCATILDSLGNCDTFIEEIGEWESQQMTLEEWIQEQAEIAPIITTTALWILEKGHP